MHFQNNQSIKRIVTGLSRNNFKVYMVGGAVRDAMLDRVPGDVDLMTNASMDEICGVFQDRKVKKVGHAFPVCLVDGVEVSSARCAADSRDFPESDLACRDFTINAMAWDMEENVILDPFNGRDDLKEKIIRFTVNPEERIKEDPIRMVRACRFAAMIEGCLETETCEAILSFGQMLDSVTATERIRIEVMKAMQLKKPSLFFIALKATGLLKKIFPSLDRCYTLDGGPHHGETVFEHCLLVGDALPASNPMLRLAGYLHDTGKFDAAKMTGGHLSFPGHENDYRHLVEDLERLRFFKKEVAYAKALTLAHMRPLTDESTPKAVRRLMQMLEELDLDYRDFMRMRIADRAGNVSKPPYTISELRARLKKIYEELNPRNAFTVNDIHISGHEIAQILNIEPGPVIGQIKKKLFDMVLEDPGLNNKDDLSRICRSLKIEK